tara:strand:+ start:1845 stop:2549 length:705 start_codon:yes stop_codon:yes gene_type:complete
MPDISSELDRIAEIIATKSNKAVEEVVNTLIELTQGKTGEEALEILSGINLKYAMESKMAGAFALYDQGIASMLDNMYTTTFISEIKLRLLLDNSKRILSSEFVDKMSANILQKSITGISSKLTVSEILESIKDVTPEMETQVVTAFGQYSNAVANLLAETLPDDTKFIYIGAYDSKTRPKCEQKIGFSPATKSDIIGRFGDFNNEIWNCRHRWEQISSSPKDQGFQEEKFVSA